MNIFDGFENLTLIPNPVLTIGTFDGVHIGHQKILHRLDEEAKKIGGESVLFTFYPHPRMVLFPENHGLKLIQTQEEKLEKLKKTGLQNIIVHPFTPEFANLTATEFVRDYLVARLKIKKLVIGYDHQFGKNREGTLEFLKDISKTYGFEVIEISAQEIDEVNISSTKIRQSIESGDIDTANKYLGSPFELKGTVIKGKELGRTIGFPTANLKIESELKIVPGKGVYVAEVTLADASLYRGMMNIGIRPTVSDESNVSVEIHLFDFSADLYGQEITVRLLSRIRDEQKFNSIDDLINQLREDEKFSRQYTSGLHF